MNLSHVSLLLVGLLLLVAGYLAMDNRTKLLLEQQRTEQLERELARTGGGGPAALPAGLTQAPAPAAPAQAPALKGQVARVIEDRNPIDPSDLKAELDALEKERAILNEKVQDTLSGASPSVGEPTIPVDLTAQQHEIVAATRVATVKVWQPEYQFAVLDATDLPKGETFAIRRNSDVIARVQISGVEPDGCIADLDANYPIAEGIVIREGDEVIRFEG